MTIGGQTEKVFKGSVLFCSADTPAPAFMGGFKQSVSAYRLCRHCMATKNEWKHQFREEEFVLRDEDSHDHQIIVISEPNVRKQVTAFWKKR